mmetsp:Transcript_44058/g.94416  ORF Transcript_44058/g.94416 Transcript_44058/m.94416 type:complete len:537 (-) Transcript_44058:283-1893(-)
MQYDERDRQGPPSNAGFSDARGGFDRQGPPNGSQAPDRYDNMDHRRGDGDRGYGGPPPQQPPYDGYDEYDRAPPPVRNDMGFGDRGSYGGAPGRDFQQQQQPRQQQQQQDFRGAGGGSCAGGGPGQAPSQAGRRPPPENECFGGRPNRPTSNAFAMGANQNCGNVLTDTPTTRVNAPPGGATSVCLNWDDAGPPPGPPQRQGQRNQNNDRSGAPAPWEGSAPGGDRRGDYRDNDYRDDYRRQDQYARQPGPDQSNLGPNGHGSRPRVSGNTFANGSNQNCGNVLTDTPSTRVVAPPGGASSFNLGWQTDTAVGGSNSPQRRNGNSNPMQGGDRGDPYDDGAPYQQGPPPRGQGQYDDRGYDDRQQRRPEAHNSPPCSPQGGGYDRYDPRDDIEGSRPRSYKPGIRLNAPPGGGATFSPDWDPEVESRSGGKKLFPGQSGAGNNRDMAAIESMRYYQTEERPGKQRPDMGRPMEDSTARDSHRYYLAGDDRADRVPGKAQCSPQGREGARDHMSWPDQGPVSLQQRRNQQLYAERPF